MGGGANYYEMIMVGGGERDDCGSQVLWKKIYKINFFHAYLRLVNSNFVDPGQVLKIIYCIPVERAFFICKNNNTIHCRDRKDFTKATTL